MPAEPGSGHHVCALEELPVGRARTIHTARGPVAVFRTTTGIYALDDCCSHAEVPLCDGFIEDDTVECPAHSSLFCLRTGRPLNRPATEPVATWAVHVIRGQIYLGPRQPLPPPTDPQVPS